MKFCIKNFMENSIMITQISRDVFFEELRKIVREEIQALQAKENDEKRLSISEFCNLFVPKISAPTFYKWVKLGIVPVEKFGRKTYVKHSSLALLKSSSIKRTFVQPQYK